MRKVAGAGKSKESELLQQGLSAVPPPTRLCLVVGGGPDRDSGHLILTETQLSVGKPGSKHFTPNLCFILSMT